MNAETRIKLGPLEYQASLQPHGPIGILCNSHVE